MDVIKNLIERAQQNKQRIVLPEGTEERTLKAADKALADGIAELVILGNKEEILALAQKNGLTNIGKATIIDPENNPDAEKYANLLFELRKAKGMTMEDAQKLVCNPLYLGCLIIKNGDADGQVAGALNTTGNVLRPALQIIKTTPGITCVSGAMMLITNAKEYGEDGVLFVADVAVTPQPDANQLSKGSAKHEMVDKVTEATRLAHELDPELSLDGELQADAALVPFVGQSKAPGSTVAGKANVLVFPDLGAGNIGYKLVQRLGHAEAIGPVLQGIARPVNDLSRGCSVEDVYMMIAITANQAIAAKK